MAKNLQPLPDPEDMFADTRMSVGDHIEDLRNHLLRAVYGFLIGMVVCLLPPVGPWAVKKIAEPVEVQLHAFHARYINNLPKPSKEELDRVPPIRVEMKVHVASLKNAIEGKREVKALEGVVESIDDLLRRFDVPAAQGEKAVWVAIPVEIPDPYQITKAIDQVKLIEQPKRLTTLNVQEAFVVYIKVGLLVGFVVSSPWVFYQIWSFVAAGLYPHEKRLVNHYLPISIGLFFAGFVLCQFFALPRAIEGLLWFNEWLGFQPDLRLNEWLSFAILMPLVFGLSFQTPIVMLFLYKIGIVPIDTFRSKRSICFFVMAIFAALITPSTDAITMILLWLPMCLLFEVGIWMCMMQPQSSFDDSDEDGLDEMVGV